MKPFTVTVTFEWFEWTLPWTKRRRVGKTKPEIIDVRQFADVVWGVSEDHVAKAARALVGLESSVLEAIGGIAGACKSHEDGGVTAPPSGSEPSEGVRRLLRGAKTFPR